MLVKRKILITAILPLIFAAVLMVWALSSRGNNGFNIQIQSLPAGDIVRVMILDSSKREMYLGISSAPGKVYQIDIDTLAIKSSLVLSSGENFLASGFMDEEGGKLYFGTATTPAKIIKIDLETFQKEKTLILSEQHPEAISAYFDKEHNLGYFGFYPHPGKITVLDLEKMKVTQEGEWESLRNIRFLEGSRGKVFIAAAHRNGGTVLAGINLENLELKEAEKFFFEEAIGQGIMDESGEGAYFPTTGFPPLVVKVQLALLEAHSFPLEVADNHFGISQIIPFYGTNHFILLTNDSPCRVITTNLNFEIINDRFIPEIKNDCSVGFFDQAENTLYIGSRLLSAEKSESYVAKISQFFKNSRK